ncbi:MAG: MarR family transcriptional regulator, partial [Ruminococcus sp.]|nr:MarR family transcriptional regulator [Ruminococcus sp.]
MNQKTHQLLNDVNRAIIKFRGVYSAWSKKHGISYNEMLVLYTIR